MEGANHLSRLKDFFGVNMGEFAAFWKVLSNEDKERLKSEIERWDGKSEFIAA